MPAKKHIFNFDLIDNICPTTPKNNLREEGRVNGNPLVPSLTQVVRGQGCWISAEETALYDLYSARYNGVFSQTVFPVYISVRLGLPKVWAGTRPIQRPISQIG